MKPGRVIILNAGVEPPTDIQGVLYIAMKGNWKHDLLKELQAD